MLSRPEFEERVVNCNSRIRNFKECIEFGPQTHFFAPELNIFYNEQDLVKMRKIGQSLIREL